MLEEMRFIRPSNATLQRALLQKVCHYVRLTNARTRSPHVLLQPAPDPCIALHSRLKLS